VSAQVPATVTSRVVFGTRLADGTRSSVAVTLPHPADMRHIDVKRAAYATAVASVAAGVRVMKIGANTSTVPSMTILQPQEAAMQAAAALQAKIGQQSACRIRVLAEGPGERLLSKPCRGQAVRDGLCEKHMKEAAQ
jgi:hypothetical protein